MKDILFAAGKKSIHKIFSYAVIRETIRKYTRNGTISRKFWGKFPVDTNFHIEFPHGISVQYVSSVYDGIGRQLYWKGVQEWEYETIEVFCRLAKHAHRVLDIGANTGTYALIACAASPKTTVIAYEPVPRIYSQFLRAVEQNGFEQRCTVHCAAVSDTEGLAQFNVPNQGIPTVSSLHVHGFRGNAGTLIEVPLHTIDGSIAKEDPIDLVKIDVEGFEDHVLRGMTQTIQRHQPAIILECNIDGPIDALNFEREKYPFYELYHLQKSGPVPIKSFHRATNDHLRNFLLLPQSKKHWL